MDKLQWGNRKRLRCVKVKTPGKSDDGFVVKKKITSRADLRVLTTEEPHHFPIPAPPPLPPVQSPNQVISSSRDLGMDNNNNNINRWRSNLGNEGGKMLLSSSSCSPEKEEYSRYYMTRGSVGGLDESCRSKSLIKEAPPQEDNNNNNNNRCNNHNNSSSSSKFVWPRLFIALSSKEKEEDFMAMKGCKPPQRPKKRAKLIQKSLLFVSPGAWLSDLCQERYEVREKKTSKKRPRGLKAMGSIESDSE